MKAFLTFLGLLALAASVASEAVAQDKAKPKSGTAACVAEARFYVTKNEACRIPVPKPGDKRLVNPASQLTNAQKFVCE